MNLLTMKIALRGELKRLDDERARVAKALAALSGDDDVKREDYKRKTHKRATRPWTNGAAKRWEDIIVGQGSNFAHGFTAGDLLKCVGMPRAHMLVYLSKLTKRGVLDRLQRGVYRVAPRVTALMGAVPESVEAPESVQ